MAGVKSPLDDRYGRLEAGEPVRTLYRVVLDRDGSVRALHRIAWNGNDAGWIFGDGYFAHDKTGWRWCPEDFSSLRGMAWTISGMGGADDDSEAMSQEEALGSLRSTGPPPIRSTGASFPPTRSGASFSCAASF